MLPPYLQEGQEKHNLCLIVEGDEEELYFNRLNEKAVFSPIWNIKIVNAHSESSIPLRYQAEYNKNYHEVVLIVCDKDREPKEFDLLIKKMDLILGEGKSKEVIFFTCPCTLQIILSHFGEVELKTQAKKEARPIVEMFTGVQGYDAHKEQLQTICSKITQKTYCEMKQRICKMSSFPEDIPSTNLLELFENLENNDLTWIREINARLEE